ncbi:MAG TPA: OadG family transporter subunit [Opitutaceae bacterium]|nr:OadG family transporter subunit [Opitutaceae bacterium]
MISRLFLGSGAIIAAASDAGSLETIKNVLLIVFLAVGTVWLLLEARRNLTLSYGETNNPAPAPAAVPTVVAPAAVSSRIPAEIIAVITAAVHASLGNSAQVVAIAGADDNRTWAAEGRRAIYATRKVR